ncbi:LptE family protein [Labilibaculum sp. K2S]|uniref:LptE family protein n=1 Tax=Labilibaculum sp. K2S TaxID=3056386 RepID=UPI0025A42959|nr:LptE family protein [Labilibaculum sp. K2S]MDM8162179.1 LptE family protein [Labilibaculum sp. K2S]
MNLIKVLFLSFCVAFVVTACKVSYSFTGGTLSTDVKTFSVQFFPNRAPLVNPNLSNQFTEALKEKFRGQTSLDEIVDGEGQLNFEGEITGYRTQALDVTADDISATNRLTVTVKVRFTNEIEPDNDFDKSFSAFRDFDSTKQLSDVEEGLVVEILEDIIDDIYNEAVVNW